MSLRSKYLVWTLGDQRLQPQARTRSRNLETSRWDQDVIKKLCNKARRKIFKFDLRPSKCRDRGFTS